MSAVPETVAKRLEKNLDAAKERVIKANKKSVQSKSEVLDLYKYLALKLFGFTKPARVIDLSVSGVAHFYLGIESQDEVKYLLDLPLSKSMSEKIDSTIEYATRHHIEWLVRTNDIDWQIYRADCVDPNHYDLVSLFNLVELNYKNENDLMYLFLLSKEKHTKTLVFEEYNRWRYHGFLSKDKSIIDYMFLIDVSLYDDGSEKVYIPLLDLTFRCDQPFAARQNAEKALEKYLKHEFGKEYDFEHRFQSTASVTETTYLKTNHPVWW